MEEAMGSFLSTGVVVSKGTAVGCWGFVLFAEPLQKSCA